LNQSKQAINKNNQTLDKEVDHFIFYIFIHLKLYSWCFEGTMRYVINKIVFYLLNLTKPYRKDGHQMNLSWFGKGYYSISLWELNECHEFSEHILIQVGKISFIFNLWSEHSVSYYNSKMHICHILACAVSNLISSTQIIQFNIFFQQ
jgi:hypothetical protein